MNDTLTLIVALLGAGYFAARSGVFPDNAAETLNRFVIYVCVPSVVLTLVPKLQLEPSLALVVLVPWLLIAVTATLVVLVSRALRFSDEVEAVLLLCVPLGNTSFLGFPMIEALVGRQAVRYAVLYDQLGSFLSLTSYALFVLARYGGQEKPTARGIAQRMAKFPPFIALCAGLLMPRLGLALPGVLDAVLSRVGATLVPLAMFAVGLKLQLRPPRPWLPLAFGLATKMALMPLLALAIVHVAGAQGVLAKVLVLEAGMPAMISAGALAMMAGLAPELAAALVGYGIVLSLVTLPLLASLL